MAKKTIRKSSKTKPKHKPKPTFVVTSTLWLLGELKSLFAWIKNNIGKTIGISFLIGLAIKLIAERAVEIYWKNSECKDVVAAVEELWKTTDIDSGLAYCNKVLEREICSDELLIARIKLVKGKFLVFKETGSNNEEIIIEAIENLSAAHDIFIKHDYNAEMCNLFTYQGIAYRLNSDIREKKVNLEISLAYFRKALECIPDNKERANNYLLNKEIGVCFTELAYINQSVEQCDSAIKYLDRVFIYWTSQYTEESISILPSICHGLGCAYTEKASLSNINNKDNIKLSIFFFNRCLDFWKVSIQPVNYAMVQMNLGSSIAIQSSILDSTGLLWNAIECYKNALEVYKPEKYPSEYCMAMWRSGNIYMNLNKEMPSSISFTQIEEYFNLALSVLTVESNPNEYANVLFLRSTLYLDNYITTSNVKYLFKANDDNNSALSVFRNDAFPTMYATSKLQQSYIWKKLLKVDTLKKISDSDLHRCMKEVIETLKDKDVNYLLSIVPTHIQDSIIANLKSYDMTRSFEDI